MIKTKIFMEGFDDPSIDDPNSIILVGEDPKETDNNGK